MKKFLFLIIGVCALAYCQAQTPSPTPTPAPAQTNAAPLVVPPLNPVPPADRNHHSMDELSASTNADN